MPQRTALMIFSLRSIKGLGEKTVEFKQKGKKIYNEV